MGLTDQLTAQCFRDISSCFLQYVLLICLCCYHSDISIYCGVLLYGTTLHNTIQYYTALQKQNTVSVKMTLKFLCSPTKCVKGTLVILWRCNTDSEYFFLWKQWPRFDLSVLKCRWSCVCSYKLQNITVKIMKRITASINKEMNKVSLSFYFREIILQ